jgi:hypothetical protein
MALNLTKPDIGSTGWGAAVNQNFEDIENDLAYAYFNAYRTDVYDLAAANTWYDLPWNVAATVKQGFTHDHTSSPEQITVSSAGTYLITYMVSTYYAGPHYSFVARLLDDGTEIGGSYCGRVRDWLSPISHSVICEIAAGSILELQVGTDLSGMDIEGYDSASMPDATVRQVASISIVRLGPTS